MVSTESLSEIRGGALTETEALRREYEADYKAWAASVGEVRDLAEIEERIAMNNPTIRES